MAIDFVAMMSFETISPFRAFPEMDLQQVQNPDRFARGAALAVLALLTAQCVVAAFSLVALHGDGAWFIFTLAADQPWSLKWASLANRAAVYVAVVLPTEYATDVLNLTGTQIARVYGFLFNFVQLVQFGICVGLGWRRDAALLIFPVAQYAFGNALGFGYMSEILLGTGFFWVCFFLVLRRPIPLVGFAICFAGLVFSHELVAPSTLLVVIFAWLQRDARDRRTVHSYRELVLLVICGIVLGGWVALRLAGGGVGADNNPLATFDPRRIINNPTLWLIAVPMVTLITFGRITPVSRRLRLTPGSRLPLLTVIIILCVAVPLALRPWLNFAQGRYDSARTVIGIVLFLFGCWAVLTVEGGYLPHQAKLPPPSQLITPVSLVAVLAINVGASAAFLVDWTIALNGFSRLAQTNLPGESLDLMAFDQAKWLLTADERVANDRMGLAWTWPFRLTMLAPAYHPAIVTYDPNELHFLCDSFQKADPDRGKVPANIVLKLKTLFCSAPTAPARRRFIGRTFDRLKAIFDSTVTPK